MEKSPAPILRAKEILGESLIRRLITGLERHIDSAIVSELRIAGVGYMNNQKHPATKRLVRRRLMGHERCYAHAMTMSTATRVFDARKLKGLKNISWLTSRQDAHAFGLPCLFGGRPGRGAHRALATLHERIAGSKVGWVLEADLKNFFGSLSHEWMLRFVEHRVGDQPWSATGTRCFAAGAGRAASDGRCSIRSRCNLHSCDRNCISHIGSCKRSLRCESTSDERSAGRSSR
jgi:hypothetical protein